MTTCAPYLSTNTSHTGSRAVSRTPAKWLAPLRLARLLTFLLVRPPKPNDYPAHHRYAVPRSVALLSQNSRWRSSAVSQRCTRDLLPSEVP